MPRSSNRVARLAKETLRIVAALFVAGNALAIANVDVALHARYTYSPAPGYERTQSPADSVKLTDGEFAQGRFWTARAQTVGWYQSGVIRIEIDLAAEHRIDRICINTARGIDADVSFPERADVFVSRDHSAYAYVGDAMRGGDHADGPYRVAKFCGGPIGVPARYVLLMLQPRGSYTFVDEIEVFGTGTSVEADLHAYPLRRDEADALQGRLFHAAMRARAWRAAASKLAQAAAQRAMHDAKSAAVRRRLDVLARQPAIADARTDETESADRLEDELLRLHHVLLARGYAEGPIVWHENPWSRFTPLDTPLAVSSSRTALRFDLAQNNSGSDAIIVTNNAATTRRYIVTATLDVAVAAPPSISVREVVPILVADGTLRGDPLIDLTGQSVTIRSGESKQLWISVSATGSAYGRFTGRIEIVEPAKPKAAAIAVPVDIEVWPVRLPRTPSLYVNAWSYLSLNAIGDAPERAVADLLAHHVNVFVLDETQVPWPRFDGGERWTVDYAAFDTFVARHRDAKQLLFYLEFNSAGRRSFGGQVEFLSEPWKRVFSAWIDGWARHAAALGLAREQFAFYPVDEPKDDEEATALISTAQLIKGVDPQLVVYTTLGALGFVDILRAARFVDIFQVPDSQLGSAKVGLLRGLERRVWSYTGGDKRADPLSRYRAQAWRAFAYGAQGVGFWAYADVGPAGTAWDDLDGTRPDAAVVYESPDGPVSSKRWEAWREGVEDYSLLERAQRDGLRRGSADVRDGVGAVLAGDIERLQQIRRRLLSTVAGGARPN